jgi:hypothetical protein
MSIMEKVKACDSEALRVCLERNNNDRSKCMKEWEDFKRACAAKPGKSEVHDWGLTPTASQTGESK